MIARLCYVSKRTNPEENLIEDIIDILSVARNFNTKHKIFGVLYYADNNFFQCLEGEKKIIEALFEKIKQDKRHYITKHFEAINIHDYSFKKWSMKYVEKNSKIEHFFKENGTNSFDPLVLDDHNINDFIQNLLVAHQTETKIKPKTGFTNRGVIPLV